MNHYQAILSICKEAYRLIKTEGHIKGKNYVPGCGYCFSGAVQTAIYNKYQKNPTLGRYITGSNILDSINHTARMIVNKNRTALTAFSFIWAYNDKPKTTKEDILNLLKEIPSHFKQE